MFKGHVEAFMRHVEAFMGRVEGVHKKGPAPLIDDAGPYYACMIQERLSHLKL